MNDDLFDQLMELAQDWCRAYTEHRDCPRSEEPWRENAMHQAKQDFIDAAEKGMNP